MKKLLIIDDDPDVLEAVQMVLKSVGYEAETTLNGNSAYLIAKRYKPDLIILDLLLSGMDGREVCHNLKNDTETKNIPIVMISAHPAANVIAERCGADGFISKPFSVRELLGEVGRYIDG